MKHASFSVVPSVALLEVFIVPRKHGAQKWGERIKKQKPDLGKEQEPKRVKKQAGTGAGKLQ